MGAKVFLLAPALNAMIGQRLVRRLCDNCKKEDNFDDETKEKVLNIVNKLPKEELDKIDTSQMKFHKTEGCDQCQGIGYKGRIGIFEGIKTTEAIAEILESHPTSRLIKKTAREQGTMSLQEDGINKLLKGITSIDELDRVIDIESDE
jgi:type IV pilus assembly protein PilB